MKSINSKINLIPLGGLEEVGKNCLIIEDSKHIVIIDCGVKFSNDHNFGLQFEIPNFKYLLKNKKKIAGIIITHGHLDHIGALVYLLDHIKTNIYGSNFVLELIKKSIKNNQIKNNNFILYKENINLKIGNFNFLPFNVNHSIIDSFGFIIDLNIKDKSKIVHTGDFNMDNNPYKRYKTNLEPLKKIKNNVLLLLSDSTNATKKTSNISETQVFLELKKIILENKNKNKIIITIFSTQIPRLLKIFDIAKLSNRKIFISGRSISDNFKILIKRPEYKHLKEQVINHKNIKNFKKIIVIASGTQGEKQASIAKISEGSHKFIKATENDIVIFSSSIIPGNEKDVFKIWNIFAKNNIDYITSKERNIHTSGHGAEKELKKIISTCNPEYFIPIHGENRHLAEHKKIGIINGIKKEKILIAENGQIIEILNNKIQINKSIKILPQLISNQYKKIETKIINERKEIGMNGIIFLQILNYSSITIHIQSYGVFFDKDKKEEMKKINIFLTEKIIKNNLNLEKKSYKTIYTWLENFFKSKFINIPIIIINFPNN